MKTKFDPKDKTNIMKGLKKLKEQGFHLGDDWHTYCEGSHGSRERIN